MTSQLRPVVRMYLERCNNERLVGGGGKWSDVAYHWRVEFINSPSAKFHRAVIVVTNTFKTANASVPTLLVQQHVSCFTILLINLIPLSTRNAKYETSWPPSREKMSLMTLYHDNNHQGLRLTLANMRLLCRSCVRFFVKLELVNILRRKTPWSLIEVC